MRDTDVAVITIFTLSPDRQDAAFEDCKAAISKHYSDDGCAILISVPCMVGEGVVEALKEIAVRLAGADMMRKDSTTTQNLMHILGRDN